MLLAVLGGGSLAAGDLFDDNYKDCPHKTRLRDNQIADLAVACDTDEADEVNVAWSATDPAAWGLGPNAYRTSLVVILDDQEGDPVAKTLALGTHKATFDDVATGTEVTVQLAIVVDTADGDYLISDILEQRLLQSLTAPAFTSSEWRWVRTLDDPATPANELETVAIPMGTMYYVGYNENFANYRADGLRTLPTTSGLRIGLAHGGESDKARDAVDFKAYRIRITDADGDVVPEADDAATVASQPHYTSTLTGNQEQLIAGTLTGATDAYFAGWTQKFSNVRVVEGDSILPAMWGGFADVDVPFNVFGTTPPIRPLSRFRVTTLNNFHAYARSPDAHRDFPLDTLASDETYRITAWAVNDDGEVVSPVAALSVRPRDTAHPSTQLEDFYNGAGIVIANLTITEFTVLK